MLKLSCFHQQTKPRVQLLRSLHPPLIQLNIEMSDTTMFLTTLLPERRWLGTILLPSALSSILRSVSTIMGQSQANLSICLHPVAKQPTSSQTAKGSGLGPICCRRLNVRPLSWICVLHIQFCCTYCGGHANWILKVLQCRFQADVEFQNLATHKAELIRAKQPTEGRVSVSGGKSVCPFHLAHNGTTPPCGCLCTQICSEALIWVNKCSRCSRLTGLPDRQMLEFSIQFF